MPDIMYAIARAEMAERHRAAELARRARLAHPAPTRAQVWSRQGFALAQRLRVRRAPAGACC